MKIKHMISSALIALIGVTAAACGDDDPEPGPGTSGGEENTASTLTLSTDKVILNSEAPESVAFTANWTENNASSSTVQLSKSADFRSIADFPADNGATSLGFTTSALNSTLLDKLSFTAGVEATLYVRLHSTYNDGETADSNTATILVTPYEPAQSETPATEGLAKGADVSWLTKLESEGYKFYTPDADRRQMECMELLRDYCGVNSIRLRVWVDPTDGDWNGIDDTVTKARRAKQLGLRLMIDFHFSDTWADPGAQNPPAAWKDYDIADLKQAVSAHVNEMLTALKAEDIEPEWVQIGNETPDGFLFPLGNATSNPDNFAALITTGNDAVKAVFPNAKVIVHVDQGDNLSRFTWLFNILKTRGAAYDMIGMSLYPDYNSWQTPVNNCIDNIVALNSSFGKPVMICETGLSYYYPDRCAEMLGTLLDAASAGGKAEGILEGVFYWEPEAPPHYNGGYDKGAFDNNAPTSALPDSFGR